MRERPNILITGTPGTGKTTTCELVADLTGLEHMEIGKIVKQNSLYDSYDSDLDCYILDEDKVVDFLDGRMSDIKGGVIVDHHGCDFFPERWFDLVVVLQCCDDTSVLYDRLKARGYSDRKIEENMQCEIMRVISEEAAESYASDRIVELRSATVDDMEQNVNRIDEWITVNFQ